MNVQTTVKRGVFTIDEQLVLKTNKLYYGNDLDILRKFIRDETADIFYIDPPFIERADNLV